LVQQFSFICQSKRFPNQVGEHNLDFEFSLTQMVQKCRRGINSDYLFERERKSHSLSRDRMSMQIDIKNMSKINNVKQETFKIYEIL
jgi:hypothetical protein